MSIVDDAVQEFFNAGYIAGDLVTKNWLLTELGINTGPNADPFELLTKMEAFKEILLKDHKIALRNVRGAGYEVVAASDQAEFAAQTAAHHFSKGIKKANALLTHTDMQQLTRSEHQRHVDTQLRMAAVSGMITKARRDIFSAFNKSKAVSKQP